MVTILPELTLSAPVFKATTLHLYCVQDNISNAYWTSNILHFQKQWDRYIGQGQTDNYKLTVDFCSNYRGWLNLICNK